MKTATILYFLLTLSSLSLISSQYTLTYYALPNCTGYNKSETIFMGCQTLDFYYPYIPIYNNTEMKNINLFHSMIEGKFKVELYGSYYNNRCVNGEMLDTLYMPVNGCMNVDNGSVMIDGYYVIWMVGSRLVVLLIAVLILPVSFYCCCVAKEKTKYTYVSGTSAVYEDRLVHYDEFSRWEKVKVRDGTPGKTLSYPVKTRHPCCGGLFMLAGIVVSVLIIYYSVTYSTF
eukprot:TRINITY_DN527_c0_g1_i1.p1 TRINITY_DN527_c0_g1~~TRINITY_DN527_c0_g1_i1.p1  ORF type:complete len:257 (-),score=30.41 TRINITY_DN527_c0_g1_i1:40-729(-)